MKRLITLVLLIATLFSFGQSEHLTDSQIDSIFSVSQKYKSHFWRDGGDLQNDRDFKLYLAFAELENMSESIEFCWFGQAATKQRKDGIYSYAEKLYDIYNFNDATQTTPASQPLFKNVTYALDNSFSPVKKSAIYSTSREFLNIPPITVNGTLTIVDKKGDDVKPTAKHYDIDSTITTIEFTGDLFAYIIHGNTLTAAQKQAETDFFNHLYYSYTYTDVMKFTVDAGLFDFSYNNPNRLWVFPDGTTSTAARPAKTLSSAGDVYLYSNNYDGNYRLNANTTDARFTGDLSDLQGKITYYLSLNSCTNVTGDLSDLQGKITNYLNLNNCSNVTGVYTPSGTALPTSTYLDNTNISSTDMDATLINYAAQATAINKQNGTFRANGMTRTAASDAAVSTLTGLGWTVSGLIKI